MSAGGELLSEIALELRKMVSPGVTTGDLDRKAEELFRKKKLGAAFLNYGVPPFPGRICASLNDEVVHGIPSDKRVLKNGDLVSIDLGGVWKGLYTDMAFTASAGVPSEKAERLMKVTRQALEAGVRKMTVASRLGDVSAAVQQLAESEGYSVVKELVGHGVGRSLHEAPNLPNYGVPGTGINLEPGLVLALEPMVNEGSDGIRYDEDRWTVRTVDGGLSCHFEYTVAVTGNGPRVLTKFLW